ncbi:hypothetical protein BJ508DRAFT_419207 [Ascobolus immersus RN42]|uniref:Uncharacterized protein n=1 Tax=Ascobolus immersus RN42 TaxID=1160509 RepID=A0A3N4HLT7_ASCIM|nr:hypothetical protein BJ508DRAFT_419207 [Ascobolus immersus RN42]
MTMSSGSEGVTMRQIAPLPRRTVRSNAALSRYPQKRSSPSYFTPQTHYIYHYGPASERKFGYLDIEEVDANENSGTNGIETIIGEFEEAPVDYKPRTTFMPAHKLQQSTEGRLGATLAGQAQRLAASDQSLNSSTAMKRSFSEQQSCDLEPLEGVEVRTKRARSEEPACVKRILLDDSVMDIGE